MFGGVGLEPFGDLLQLDDPAAAPGGLTPGPARPRSDGLFGLRDRVQAASLAYEIGVAIPRAGP
jgi:hypothetical protein